MIPNRHRWLQSAGIALLLGLSGASTHAVRPLTTTVYPTGSFPLDTQNVQTAINHGGTVILKATNAAGQPTAFDFGPPDPQVNGGVNLTTDVTILGEQIGENATTIRGGVLSILGVDPVKCTIQGIIFDGALDTPIALFRSTGANIIGNHIRGMVPRLLGAGFTEIEGIFVSGFDDPPHAITGKVKIADNIIEVAGGDFVNGMQFDEVSADIDVTGNTVNFTSSDGVIQTIGILAFRSHGKVSVTDNLVMMRAGNPDAFPVGLFAGGHFEARYMISRNTIITTHPNADGMDIVGFSPSITTEGAIVEGNHVSMQSLIPTSGGVVFAGAVKNSHMNANQIEGMGGNALQVLGLSSTLTADSNHLSGNQISQLSPLNGDIFLGTDSINTLVSGQCSTYIDLGIGNRVLCGTPLGPAVARPTEASPRARAMIGPDGDAVRNGRLDVLRHRLSR